MAVRLREASHRLTFSDHRFRCWAIRAAQVKPWPIGEPGRGIPDNGPATRKERLSPISRLQR